MSLEEFKYFFSYTRNDSEFVLKLTKELRAVGANLWLDQLDVLGGQHWDLTVEKALKSCKGMIAVLSPESVASDNVMDEVSYALEEGKLVVPVLIRSCDIPYRLRRVQYIDFTADYDTGFSQLLRALGIEQPVQPLESTAAQELVVQEPSLPKQSEPAPDALDHSKPTGVETEKAGSKSRMAKVLGAICIVTLITIISIGVFLKDRQSTDQPTGTDLIIESLTHSPETPTTADTITFTAVVKNTGSGTAGSSTLGLKVGGETFPATYSVPSLSSGETHTVQRQETLSVAQRYRNTATADFKDEVLESNETNNQKTDDYQVILPARLRLQPRRKQSPVTRPENNGEGRQPEQPPSFRVVEAFLRADPFDYVGPSPVTIKFTGRISVVGGGGTVSYKFLRSDGASAPIETFHFDGPGSRDVSTTWRLGGPGFTYSGWQSIKILEPQEMESERANFKIRCE